MVTNKKSKPRKWKEMKWIDLERNQKEKKNISRKNKFKKRVASTGNRTRALRVGGEDPATGPLTLTRHRARLWLVDYYKLSKFKKLGLFLKILLKQSQFTRHFLFLAFPKRSFWLEKYLRNIFSRNFLLLSLKWIFFVNYLHFKNIWKRLKKRREFLCCFLLREIGVKKVSKREEVCMVYL